MSSLGQQNVCDATDWGEGLMEVANSECIMLEIILKSLITTNTIYIKFSGMQIILMCMQKKVCLKEDNLFVDSVKYNVDNMNSLPGDLHQKHFSSKSNATTEVFGGIMSEAHHFSN